MKKIILTGLCCVVASAVLFVNVYAQEALEVIFFQLNELSRVKPEKEPEPDVSHATGKSPAEVRALLEAMLKARLGGDGKPIPKPIPKPRKKPGAGLEEKKEELKELDEQLKILDPGKRPDPVAEGAKFIAWIGNSKKYLALKRQRDDLQAEIDKMEKK